MLSTRGCWDVPRTISNQNVRLSSMIISDSTFSSKPKPYEEPTEKGLDFKNRRIVVRDDQTRWCSVAVEFDVRVTVPFKRESSTVKINSSVRRKQLNRRIVATWRAVGIVENGLRRGISSDIELVCREGTVPPRAASSEKPFANSGLHQRRRRCHTRRANNTGIGGAASNFKICSFESAEPRNNSTYRRAQLFKKRQHTLINVFNVSASRQRSLHRTAAWDRGVRNRRPRTLPYHCCLSSTLPMEKKVEGTE